MTLRKAYTSRLVDRRWFIRMLEIIPGAASWSALILPVVLSFFAPLLVAYFIIAFDLYWLIKSMRLSINLVRGYRRLHIYQRLDWSRRLGWLRDPESELVFARKAIEEFTALHPKSAKLIPIGDPMARRKLNILRLNERLLTHLDEHSRSLMNPDEIYHAVILATYNESRDILEPSIRALTEVDYPLNRMIFIIAYEERGGEATEFNAKALIEEYGHNFFMAKAIKHPKDIAGEIRGGGKGGNITFAGRQLTEEIRKLDIDPSQVIVTTFDSDHRASKNYFSYVTYMYASDPNRERKSFQPIPMFYNNIWDAPAPMRVIATGNSFWLLMETMRPHRLRNFAAHSQGLAALIVTDYWSVTTIVEDGHQFWRTYFAYDGDHEVVPIYTPIYQDAVFAGTTWATFIAQYKQLRRWAWGASDFQFVVRNAMKNNRITLGNKLIQTGRLFEGHFSWATASIMITAVAWLPLYLNHSFSYETLAHELPIITSRIMQLASVGLIITVFISMISLPPRPKHYRRTRSIWMVLQWVLLPFTSIIFGSFAALDAQTRLMFGKYLEFYVTDKATKKK
jgi:hypothetical protein